jgi:hypothetical protein
VHLGELIFQNDLTVTACDMTDQDTELPPIVIKVLDAFLQAMRSDESIDDAAAGRLDTLLREGRIPKQDEIDDALFPPPVKEEENSI